MNITIDKLINIRMELLDAVNKFDSDKREVVLFDKWTLKDVLAHLCGWDQLTAAVLINLINGKQSMWGKGVNEMNQESVNLHQPKSWNEIYNEFVAGSQKMIDEYSNLLENMWNQPLYPNKKFTPAKFLKIDIDHYQEHLEAIKKIL